MRSAGRQQLERSALLFGSLLFAATVLRLAWVGDDALITLRTVKQLAHGNGLVWNSAERVQSYTHPLWLCVIAPVWLVTREAYFTLTALSCAVSLAALWVLLARCASSLGGALLALAVLVSSKAWIDYSTSGLENPLTHLLLASFCWQYLAKDDAPLGRLALLAALGALTRLDTLVIFVPCLVEATVRAGRGGRLRALALGFLPLAAWELFALVYYGFVFPNTAHAKLGTGIGGGELALQGLRYLASSAALDPATACAIAAGLAVALARRRRRELALGLGALFYLAYVVRIGGDFMSGRFLTAPLACAVVVLARSLPPEGRIGLLVPAAVLVLGALWPASPLRVARVPAQREHLVDAHGVCDERAFYADKAAFLAAERAPPTRPGEILTQVNIGFTGYFADVDTHIVDLFALTDPLLARMPMAYKPDWRVGHYARFVPDGYVESLEQGRALLADPGLARYYAELLVVLRGPLLSPERLRHVGGFLIGAYDAPLRESWDALRFPIQREIAQADVATPFAKGTPNDAPGVHVLTDMEALTIRLDGLSRAARVVVSVDYNDRYDVIFLRDGRELGVASIPIAGVRGKDPGLRPAEVAVPAEAREQGFDVLRVFPWSGDSRYAVGHVELVD